MMVDKKQEIEKLIETKQIFADYAYKEYRAENFGMTSCCALQLDKYSINNELCEWQDKEKPIYNIDTVKFETWNWMNWLTGPNPLFPATWVQQRRDKYSQRRLYGMNSAYTEHNQSFNDSPEYSYNRNFRDATSASANVMTCIVKDNVLSGVTTDIIRGTSRIYAVCLDDNSGAAGILNFPGFGSPTFRDDFLQLLWKEKPEPSGWFTCPNTSCGPIHWRIQRAMNEYIWWKLNWIVLNPGGDVVPEAGDLTITMVENDGGGAGGAKTGANKQDFIFFLLVTAGELPGQIQTCNDASAADVGPNSKISLIYADSNATLFGMNEIADLEGCRFESGLTGGIGTGYGDGWLGYHEQNNQSIIGYWPSEDKGVNIGIRAMVSYANVDITSVGWCSPVMNDCDALAPNVYCLDYSDVSTCYTNRADYRTCVDDAELLYITVKDKNAAPVKDYDIMIDNTYYGKTDSSGILIVNIKNASTDTKHVINGCQCFTTSGACNQQKIDIVLKETIKPVCTNLAIDCL